MNWDYVAASVVCYTASVALGSAIDCANATQAKYTLTFISGIAFGWGCWMMFKALGV